MREILVRKAQDEATNLLSDYSFDDKGTELYPIFERFLPFKKPNTPNDGVLVMYINAKLAKKFGPVNGRENGTLLQAISEIPAIIEEIRRML